MTVELTPTWCPLAQKRFLHYKCFSFSLRKLQKPSNVRCLPPLFLLITEDAFIFQPVPSSSLVDAKRSLLPLHTLSKDSMLLVPLFRDSFQRHSVHSGCPDWGFCSFLPVPDSLLVTNHLVRTISSHVVPELFRWWYLSTFYLWFCGVCFFHSSYFWFQA